MHQNLVKLKLVDDILSETDGLHGSRGGTAVSLDRMGSVTSPFGSDDMGLEALDAIYGPSPRGHQEGVGGRWGESPFRGQHKDADTDKDADMQARAAHVCVGEVARPAAHSVTESLERLPPEKRVVPPHGAPPAPEDTPPSRIANGPSKSTCVHCEPPPPPSHCSPLLDPEPSRTQRQLSSCDYSDGRCPHVLGMFDGKSLMYVPPPLSPPVVVIKTCLSV